MSRPKVGLALGAGGARGLAHIGVIKVLVDAGIPIDYIAGSSMGSLVGSIYASGFPIHMAEQLAVNLKRKVWLDFTIPKKGLLSGEKARELVRLLTKKKRLEELDIPTAVVATDLTQGKRVVFTHGPTDEAVRASISIPGIFEPVRQGEQVLVDGGVIDRVPISVVREMGADLVIAVDVHPRSPSTQINTIFDVILESIILMEREILSERILDADVIIHPDMDRISATAFTEAKTCIARGVEAATIQVERIQHLIDHWGEEGSDEESKELD
ncbi:patatin-like phospholipase family protein [Mechercharimyces sp. CAU 1602]|uniref:patatin-like phospholipase family protein n=1 Tax=Mechercharimyces sp. CAU 1602 TaxID=2973933 RepID=UPI00216259A5|nr:patatin-like phospholipase family protein [Mechercharimyces sp. CAU 1602]MCS1351372.1 patatin-like phospholipase family protein [Mechercharimyces sp. CAU 1602]